MLEGSKCKFEECFGRASEIGDRSSKSNERGKRRGTHGGSRDRARFGTRAERLSTCPLADYF